MKKHIPNFLTCCNLFAGCLAAQSALLQTDWAYPTAWLVLTAALFDLADGLAARALHVSSPFGKELDSLADVVSFGFVPGVILFRLFAQAGVQESGLALLMPLPFLVTVFSALRLAKFNLDTRQGDSFIGLPTPANTLFILSFPLILANDEYNLKGILLNPYFLSGICLLQSWLLVSELPLMAFKFKNFSWKDNRFQFMLMLAALVLLSFLGFAAIPPIILLYVLLSLLKKKSGP